MAEKKKEWIVGITDKIVPPPEIENTAFPEADIRVLKSEKVHASQQLAAGVTAIVPVSLVVNLAKGTEGSQAKVATGDYNKMLDAKIAEIKQECGVR